MERERDWAKDIDGESCGCLRWYLKEGTESGEESKREETDRLPDLQENRKQRQHWWNNYTKSAVMPVIYFGLVTNITPLPSNAHSQSDIHETDEEYIQISLRRYCK